MRYLFLFLVMSGLYGAFIPFSPITNAQAINLVSEPGFEKTGDDWYGCGDVEAVDIQQNNVDDSLAYSGRSAGRVSYNSNTSCGSAFFDPISALYIPIDIPADANTLTVSFRYRRVGTNLFPMQVIIGDSWNYSGNNTRLPFVDADNLPGWNFYRTEIQPDQLHQIRQATGQVNIYFTIFVGGGLSSYTDPRPPIGTPGFYIDDIRVTTAIERTVESPLPADLASDGTRPIAYVSGSLGGVARMNTDGSGAQAIIPGQAGGPLSPTWSTNGRKIATIHTSLLPANNTDVTVNPAFISIVYLSDPGGRNVREVYRTSGLPGREPTFPTPSTPRVAALDVKILSLDFSPDSNILALTICTNNRYKNGETSDSSCFVQFHNIATNTALEKRDEVIRPSWGSNGLILYEDNDNYGAHEDGIWQYNRNAEQLLIAGTGAQFKPSLRQENWPGWSPDGKRFATIRNVSGYHIEGEQWIFHKAIQVYDRSGQKGGTVLLIDHGSITGGLTWSPNGKYLLYSLSRGSATDIWWLNVASGATGRMTKDGKSIAPDWRPVNAGETSAIFLPLVKKP